MATARARGKRLACGPLRTGRREEGGGVGGTTSVLARTASGDVQPSAWLAACVAAEIGSGAAVTLGRGGCFRGQGAELGAVEHAPLHLADNAQGRAILDQPGGVDNPLAKRAQQRPKVVLAAIGQKSGAGLRSMRPLSAIMSMRW